MSYSRPTPLSIVQTQKTWIGVDEYQDTNPLQKCLLELRLGVAHGPLASANLFGPEPLAGAEA